ncbi:hypothetical protein ElyMa_000255100 [Elysia marginata]|uniref:Uncharacterized protein n=1 Tax=Elysia marginata TaxID=1093978 RepID=A0AAV4F2G6_9GAST|nr:hypothetical protein ElyMa_000255100 [Elysia marginata]
MAAVNEMEMDKECESRRAVNRDNMAARRQSGTEEEVERHRLRDWQRKVSARQETSSKVPWTFNFALNYLPNRRYQDNPLFATGRVKVICSFCDAYRWPGEPQEICCSNG